MASKRRHDSECQDSVEEDVKKAKSEKNGTSTTPLDAGSMDSTVSDVKIVEITNDTLTLEWSSSSSEKSFSVTLEENANKNESQSKDVTSNEEKKCSVEFTNLKPLTKYTLKIRSPEKSEPAASLDMMTPPSLVLPEIEVVQEGCAHLTLAPLPESEAEGVEGYLLLVRPLEDAKDYPAAEIKDASLNSKLESVVKPPFYVAYEFSHDELSEEDGGAIQVGSGAVKKVGKYGAVQDPRLTSGGNYRVALVVIMSVEGKQTVFAKESFQMLVK